MSRSYEPGEIILGDSSPILTLAMKSYQDKICNFCFQRKSELITCSCNLIKHCNDYCRSNEMRLGHELECGSSCYSGFCQEDHEDVDVRLILFRLYCMIQMNPEFLDLQTSASDGISRSFSSLYSLPLIMDLESVTLAEKMADAIDKSFPGRNVHVEDLVRYISIIRTNSYIINGVGGQDHIAQALYMIKSEFKHSCRPTAMPLIRGNKLEIRAIASIPEGERPTLSHLPLIIDRESRRAMLEETYNIECECETCEFEVFSPHMYAAFGRMAVEQEAIFKSEEAITTPWPIYFGQHRMLVKSLGKIYSPYDQRITNLYYFAACVALRIPTTMQAVLIDLVRKADDHLRKTYGENHPFYAKFDEMAAPLFKDRFKVKCTVQVPKGDGTWMEVPLETNVFNEYKL